MPGGAAEIYTLSFSIPDLIRREVKLDEKDDSAGQVQEDQAGLGRFYGHQFYWLRQMDGTRTARTSPLAHS